MASSEPLALSHRLIFFARRGCFGPPRRTRGSPIYSASPFTPCRRTYSGGSSDCARRLLDRWYCLRPIRIGSATTQPTNPDPVGRVTKLQRSHDATAWRCCLPCSGQDFYDRACVDRVAPMVHVGYHWMASRHLPSPDFHRLDWQPYGLRAKGSQTRPEDRLRAWAHLGLTPAGGPREKPSGRCEISVCHGAGNHRF